ncbi:hypothetical protein [Burkholderia metallica]
MTGNGSRGRALLLLLLLLECMRANNGMPMKTNARAAPARTIPKEFDEAAHGRPARCHRALAQADA